MIFTNLTYTFNLTKTIYANEIDIKFIWRPICGTNKLQIFRVTKLNSLVFIKRNEHKNALGLAQ